VARIAGVDIPDDKVIGVSLTYIFGIGRSLAEEILEAAKVDSQKRAKDLDTDELGRIRGILENSYKVEGELKNQQFQNIKRLKEIKCYRGDRHKKGLPVRGQRTRCNAHTRKGKNIAVGGLKRILAKT
jgi:small subunit ribosomal protein S13